MAMRTFMNRLDTAPCRADCPDTMRGRVALAPGSGLERLRAALSFTAALAVAAALGGCSTFGVSPFPEPIRPPMEAEGEDTAVPEAQAEEEGRYSPTPGVRITRTLPEVPATHRTVFQLVPMHVVAPNQVSRRL